MGRLVEPPPAVLRTAGERAGDDYATRVAKYIPGEVLAGYVAMESFVRAMLPGATITIVTSWAVLIFAMVLTPVYLSMVSPKNAPKRLHLGLSTVAFLVWAYALGGPFSLMGVHNAQIGSILLVAFTLISGTFGPKPVA